MVDTSKAHIKKIKQMQNKRFEYYDKQTYPKCAHRFFNQRKVKVFLNNGEELTGYIMHEWRYEILLVKSDNLTDKQGRPIEKRMMIPKHSILYTANLIHLSEFEE
uniref:Uncharacterized protein n=1 Tax=Staphylococcus staphylolyticus TaxID=1287 RepID=D3X7K1_STAST|nr:hypothetical protein [Staphylococcus simulans]ADD24873.1 hypothetical protein [Staphylococcus simulans bv. staphylolyticus]ADD24922.1 hypothetical protein [Staphylococcus simulans bv. staphylolyticus]